MEQTTLQQRIEQRAKQQLEVDLIALSNLIDNNRLLRGTSHLGFPCIDDGRTIPQLLNADYSNEPFGSRNYPRIKGDYAKKLFDYWLPIYIQETTDEILSRIDQIDYLLENKDLQEI